MYMFTCCYYRKMPLGRGAKRRNCGGSSHLPPLQQGDNVNSQPNLTSEASVDGRIPNNRILLKVEGDG